MTYPGGKNGPGVYQRIITLMPPHRVYIEPFLGSGAIMRAKRPAETNIGLDLSKDARVLFSELAPIDILERVTELDRALTGELLAGYLTSKDQITVCDYDAIEFLGAYNFTGDELVYCDPPYVLSTRRGGDLYDHELTDEQHADLLAILKSLPCKVMISGYASELYLFELADWNLTTFEAMTRGGSKALEYLWFNFEPPTRLHDYSYLGEDFRERERISRKKKRWLNKLKKMDLLERQALVSAIDDTFAAALAENGDAHRRPSPEMASGPERSSPDLTIGPEKTRSADLAENDDARSRTAENSDAVSRTTKSGDAAGRRT